MSKAHKATKSSLEAATRLTVAERIQRLFAQLTPAERKAARTLLAEYPILGLDSLAKLAAQAEVSAPSVLRLVTKLGFSGYSAFQASIRHELQSRLQSPLARQLTETSVKSRPAFLAQFATAVTDNVQQALDFLPEDQFERVLAKLANPQFSVCLIGGRLTDALAYYLYLHLRAIRGSVQHIHGHPGSWFDELIDMNENTLLIVFDVRRYQHDVMEFAQAASARQAQVVLFTDQWLSPIAPTADDIFTGHVDVPSNWDSMAALIVILEAMIAALNQKHWPELASRMKERETLSMIRANNSTYQPSGA